jgi:hypothetical protein
MSVNCYNGRFVITAKSLETNVAVVMRVDCSKVAHGLKTFCFMKTFGIFVPINLAYSRSV